MGWNDLNVEHQYLLIGGASGLALIIFCCLFCCCHGHRKKQHWEHKIASAADWYHPHNHRHHLAKEDAIENATAAAASAIAFAAAVSMAAEAAATCTALALGEKETEWRKLYEELQRQIAERAQGIVTSATPPKAKSELPVVQAAQQDPQQDREPNEEQMHKVAAMARASALGWAIGEYRSQIDKSRRDAKAQLETQDRRHAEQIAALESTVKSLTKLNEDVSARNQSLNEQNEQLQNRLNQNVEKEKQEYKASLIVSTRLAQDLHVQKARSREVALQLHAQEQQQQQLHSELARVRLSHQLLQKQLLDAAEQLPDTPAPVPPMSASGAPGQAQSSGRNSGRAEAKGVQQAEAKGQGGGMQSLHSTAASSRDRVSNSRQTCDQAYWDSKAQSVAEGKQLALSKSVQLFDQAQPKYDL